MLATLFASRPSKTQLLDTLAGQRQMLSLMEKEMLVATGAFSADFSNGVKTYTDPCNTVTSDCGTMRATRAILRDGTLVWLVLQNAGVQAYHSEEHDPFAAMEAALATWMNRLTRPNLRAKLAAKLDQPIAIAARPAAA